MRKMFLQFIVYVIVGATSTGVDYSTYFLLTRFDGMASLTANPIAYVAGNIVSFLGHRSVTFRSHGEPLRQYLRFIIVTGAGLVVSQLVLWLFLGFGVNDLTAKAFAVIFSGASNYTANRFWTFRPTGDRP